MPKILGFTDVHLGKKGNSRTHNQDVLDFLTWALAVGKEKGCEYACFLGDWHDDRTKLDARTLNFSQKALELIDGQDYLKKTWFLVGNHDLYYRHHRNTHSVPHANPLKKIQVIDEPYREGEILFLPYLFPHEYEKHLKGTDAKFVFGHLELKGFIITGTSNYKMPSGPDATLFDGPRLMLSGHFHKRQAQGNVVYIGNAFPMDFGDAGDTSRGVAILDTDAIEDDDLIEFVDWPDCPQYIRCELSKALEDPSFLAKKARVRCSMDIKVSYEEAAYIKEKFMTKFGLREFQLEDPQMEEQRLALGDDELAMKEIKIGDMDDILLAMLEEVSAPGIDNDHLQKIYREL